MIHLINLKNNYLLVSQIKAYVHNIINLVKKSIVSNHDFD
jgi:hypothetical protein